MIQESEWKDFKGYKVFDGGKIIGKKGDELRNYKGTSGYFQLNSWEGKVQKTYLIHRIVAQLYVPNPLNLLEVNHDDGNKENNWSWNLKWCTRPQNIQHAFDNGLISKAKPHLKGAKNKRSKKVLMFLNGEQINSFESTGDAAEKTGYSRSTIQDACRGRIKTYKSFTWAYETPPTPQ